MSSFFGNYIKLSLFGQSHGKAVGIVIDGFPAGMKIDSDHLISEMNRRAPGRNSVSTMRKENDLPDIVSGVVDGVTTGQPICAVIQNSNQHSSDYGESLEFLRPSHGDYTGHVRYYGYEDFRGGGHFSGRLTAPIVFAGALCSQYLAEKSIRISTCIRQIGTVSDDSPMEKMTDDDAKRLRTMEIPTLDPACEGKMKDVILQAKSHGDSVGGKVECCITGLEAGLGAPFFDSVESVLAHLMFAIPGMKAIEFGAGFGFGEMSGSAANDPIRIEDGKIVTSTNNAGGINGGITNGMPVEFCMAFRPTPSIALPQKTVSLKSMENVEFSVKGRHDPCIVPRAVPVVDAMAAIGVMEMIKERASCIK